MHVGIVLMFLGFAGEGFSRDEQLLLKPGEEATVGDYTLHLDAIRVTDDGQKQMVTGHITVKDADGEVIDQMYPAKWFFRKHEDEPTTEVAIRRDVCRRPLHRDAGVRAPGADRQRRSAHQSARELGVVRLRHSRYRHGHRAAAGKRVSFAMAKTACRSGDGDDLLLLDAAVDRRCVRAARRDRTGSAAAADARREAREVAQQARLLVRRVFEAAGWSVFVRALRDRARRRSIAMLKEGQKPSSRSSSLTWRK